MNFEDIEFTEWQIDKIRIALNSYRIVSARNGRLVSWECVCEDIKYSEVNIHNYDEGDDDLKFKSESLRRFAAAINILEREKLEDVTRFLLHTKMISLDELEESQIELKEMLQAHHYLAAKSKSAQDYIRSMEGIYKSYAAALTGEYENITIRMLPDPSGSFVRVEEIYEVSVGNILGLETQKEREARISIRILRAGYGFAVTEENCLHVFLKGESPITCAAYVQVEYHSSRNREGFCMLRHGQRYIIPRHHKVNTNGSVQLFNAFHFIVSN